MRPPPPLAQQAIEHARRRDFDKALATAKMALESDKDDVGLLMFVGLLHTRRMEFAEALPLLREASRRAPNDAVTRLELSRTLFALGHLDEAERMLESPGLPFRETRNLIAGIKARKGDVNGAVDAFRQLATANPEDFESWANLGVALLNQGNPRGAADALGRSLKLRPDRPRVLDKWAEAIVAAGLGEETLGKFRDQLTRSDEALLHISAARLEDLLGRPQAAVADLERLLSLESDNPVALAMLADLYERENRLDESALIIERLADVAPDAETLPFLRANLAMRQGRLEEALEFAKSASPVTDPGSRAHLIGKISDRMGDPEAAWDAYAAMNREDGRAVASATTAARDYRKNLERQIEDMSPQWANDWTVVEDATARPAFLLGFPRSGTTLLDTFLMGHPGICVSEENPLLQAVSDAAPEVGELPDLSSRGVQRLRDIYFEEAAKHGLDWNDRLLVDKLPFALIAGAHIHRLFPGAPIIFVERHPCDVVLSCLFNRFQPTGPGASFVDLEDTAKLYDVMMRFWFRTRDLLPLNVHEVRYERMVEDPAAELRKATEFLGLEWNEELVAHRDTAARRGFIKTPSYSQVVDPVYRSSVGRWSIFRGHLEPVLPYLAPWVERFGYSL